LIIFPKYTLNGRDVYHHRSETNCPVIGLVFRNNQRTHDIFLTIHTEPTQKRIEVPEQLKVIRTYMNRYRQYDSWLLDGDFNRLPVRNEIGLNIKKK